MSRSDLIGELTSQTIEFFRALEARRTLDAEKSGLTSTEYRALARVVEIGQKTPKRLALSMGMSTGAITAVTDRLVANGLLERVANPADRRSIMLQPTAKGSETISGLLSAFRELMSSAASDSTDENVVHVTHFLAGITEKLRP